MKDTHKIKILSSLDEFNKRGFRVEKCCIPLSIVYITCTALTALTVVLASHFNLFKELPSILTLVVASLVIVFLHELIHAIGFTLRRKIKWKGNIKIGHSLIRMSAYCKCSAPVPFVDFLIAAVLPFVILGFGLFVFGVVVKSELLIFISIFNALSSIGDLMVFCKLLLIERPSIILDMPNDMGFFALYDEKNTCSSPETSVESM